jgi:two-component system, sensor histidine kinase and response regulator
MKTILLVDDDPQLRTVFDVALRKKGYHVIMADSGTTALALARQHLPDLILTDVHMPGGDGANLLQEIRRDPELRSKQVVLMTGRPDLVTPRKGMEDGADDFLMKPVSLGPLLKCVEARFQRASISWRVEDETLVKLRSSVPANLPHEVFTPLAGIIGLMEILRGDYANSVSEEIREIHNDVYQSSLRLHRTLRNFLLILELEDATPQALPSPLSTMQMQHSIQSGVNEALRSNPRQEDVTVEVDAPSIAAKAEDLSRIVEELVDNACKFSRVGTPVRITLGADSRLTVTDQGRGLTSEQIGKIGAFQQFDRKKHEQQGLGIGLVLVQKLAQLGNARFSMTSEIGKGTTVEVAFPAV